MSDKLPKTGRKAPKRETVRRLFALSGNQCARPDCGTVLLAASGTLVGEICHIAAESAGGPRFDPALTPDQRRSFANLLLLCSSCHALVDAEPVKYPAKTLRTWKRSREAIFEAAGDSLRRAYLHEITDEGDQVASSLPRHFKRFLKHMAAQGVEPQIDAKSPGELASYAKRLGNLTISDRQLVAAIVEKAIEIGGRDDWYGVTIHPDDLKTLLVDRKRLSDGRIARLAGTLEPAPTGVDRRRRRCAAPVRGRTSRRRFVDEPEGVRGGAWPRARHGTSRAEVRVARLSLGLNEWWKLGSWQPLLDDRLWVYV